MNTENTSYTGQGKSFIPLALLSLSLIILFSYQLYQISKTHKAIDDSSTAVEGQFNSVWPGLTQQLEKAQKIDGSLSKLVADVMDLSSKNDENAKKVMDDLAAAGIKFQPPANSGSAAPSTGTGGTP